MRVIAGSARSVPLRAPSGSDTRPTSDQIKETLFNIIAAKVPGSVFVDLFAGSGAIGIEALSRGAEKAVFVEQNADALGIIRYNLHKCRLYERAKVVRGDAASIARHLPDMAPDARSDSSPGLLIYMDPPYGSESGMKTLRALKTSEKVDGDALIIFEAPLSLDEERIGDCGFDILRVKKYRAQKHIFLRKSRTEDIS